MCHSLAAAYSNALHIPVPRACATPFSLKAHPLCLQYAELDFPFGRLDEWLIFICFDPILWPPGLTIMWQHKKKQVKNKLVLRSMQFKMLYWSLKLSKQATKIYLFCLAFSFLRSVPPYRRGQLIIFGVASRRFCTKTIHFQTPNPLPHLSHYQ